ncbi:major facilitator superfamily domain-containing protein [Cyathus striatus]|nr:major facilitator superfamily domain-containing protein [Cyathus striatus]
MSHGSQSSSSVDETVAVHDILADEEKDGFGVARGKSEEENKSPDVLNLPPPDGGQDAWMTVAGTWMIQFCTYGYLSSFGVYQDFYTREFLVNRSPSDISWIGSFQLFMMYAPGILVGKAFDRGYFCQMIAVGSVLQVFSMFMLSLAKEDQYYQVFLSQGVGMGLGLSLLFLPSMSAIGRHFRRRRALAMGIAVSGASFGGIVWPIMLNKLQEKLNFPNVIRTTAGVVALLLVLANILISNPPILPAPTVSGLQLTKFKSHFLDKPYVVSIFAAFCISLGLFFPFFYLELYAIDIGISKELASYTITLLNAGSILGRVLPNFFADKFGPFNLLVPCLVISGGLVFSIFGLTNFASISVFGILFGFWSGAYVSLIPSLLAQMTKNMAELGTRMGIAFSIVGIAMLVGTPIEGALLHVHDGHYIWFKSVIFCGVITMCGAAAMAVSRHLFIRENKDVHGGRV